MRRHPRLGRRRWAVSSLTAAGLLASLTTGIAQADDGQEKDAPGPIPVTITGPTNHDLSLQQGFPAEGEPSFEIGLRGPGEPVPDEDGGYTALHHGDFTVTIDATALEGVADVELPCGAEGLVATCSGTEIYAGEWPNPDWDVRLAAREGAEAGDTGLIRVTGAGEGLEFTEHTVNVLVDGPEFEMRRLSEPKGFEAGDTFRARTGFRNTGGVAADGVVLRISGSRGLTFPQRFSNCAYGVESEDHVVRMRRVAVCTFEGDFAPGEAYQVATPVKVSTAGFALGEILDYRFSGLVAGELPGAGSYEWGDGEKLTLEPATGSSTYTDWATLDLATHNTFDLDLTGERVDGAKDDVVTVDVALHNRGPAWWARLRAGGSEPVAFDVEVPEGATVTKSPSSCGPRGGDAGDTVYRCWTATPFLENQQRAFPFELRIDEVVEGAKGRVFFPRGAHRDEGDPANDDGWIVLNGTGDEETPGDTGGSDGTGDADGSDDGSDGDDATADGGSGGDAGDDADGTGTDGDSLALTGTGALALGGFALALLAAGGVLFAVRRRHAATVTTDDAAA